MALCKYHDTGTEVLAVAATTLLAAHMSSGLRAKRAIEKLLVGGRIVVRLENVTDIAALQHGFREVGLTAQVVDEEEVDVAALRRKLRLTQVEFSAIFNLDEDTVRNWESGRRKPDRAAMAYLRVIDTAPEFARIAQLKSEAAEAAINSLFPLRGREVEAPKKSA